MTIKTLFRDAPMGQIIRYVTKNRYLKYPEEEPDFKLPDCWTDLMNNPDRPLPEAATNPQRGSSESGSPSGGEERKERPDVERPEANDEKPRTPEGGQAQHDEKPESSGGNSSPPDEQRQNASREHLQRSFTGSSAREFTQERFKEEEQHNLEKTKSIPIVPKRTKDNSILVDWYYSDDPENPHNWTNGKRLGVSGIICAYTFVVYTSSAIYTSSEAGVRKAFNVGEIEATLGLALYVLGYGIGPLIFSPLSEIPIIGRNPIYISTMWLFVILSIPTAFAQNYPGLMVLRFLTGFFGSPCLASGGASLGDMYSLLSLPYAMMAWVAAAYCGREFQYTSNP